MLCSCISCFWFN